MDRTVTMRNVLEHLWREMYSNSTYLLFIKEMQIKTTTRYHLTPVRIAIINKSTINAEEGMEQREPSCTVGGNVN